MTHIIAVASSKGGVGKTTTSFSLAAAATNWGSVLVADLDPSISLSTQMKLPTLQANVMDVLQGNGQLDDALYATKEGILALPGSRDMYQLDVTADMLQAALGPALDEIDVIILDTRPALEALPGPMQFATRVVVPAYLDGVSMPVTADTIHLALELGLEEKMAGVLATNVRRPLTKLARDIYAGLQESGVGLEAVVWNTVQWPTALASGGLDGFPELKEAAGLIYNEVMHRTVPPAALRKFADVWRKTD